MREIRVYHTHIEIEPYHKGESYLLEKRLSKNNFVEHKIIPIGYHIENDILYVPRGIDTDFIQSCVGKSEIKISKKADDFDLLSDDYKMLVEPKSRMQKEGIDFLSSINKFTYTDKFSQLSLNLDTGDGKTVAAINGMINLSMKAIIITHQEKIKLQWIDTIKTKTNIPDEKVVNIHGTDILLKVLEDPSIYDVFLVNHQTLNSYAKNKGWMAVREFFKSIRVGLKIIDECHLFFENTLMIDYFSNTKKTFYLTATFSRSDTSEYKLFKRAYSATIRFGESTFDYVEKRKHIVFVVCYFASKPDYALPKIRTKYGFSSYKYIDYELSESRDTLIRVMNKLLAQTSHLEGKTVILSPKTESVDIIADELRKRTDDVGIIYGKNTDEENENNKNHRYISSTIKSSGTGVDIHDLRILIDLEPVGSKTLADQVRGRLREYAPDKDTYLFYLVDATIPDCLEMLKNILPVMERKCKEIHYMKVEV